MRDFFAELGRTRVFAEAYTKYVAGGNPRRTTLSEKRAISGWKLVSAHAKQGRRGIVPIYEFEDKRPRIAKSAFIHPMATLIGDVIIGEDVYIGPGAVLRGDFGSIEICDGSNVQENCVIHVRPEQKAFLDRDSHVGHGAVLHGPTIYDNVLIGMRSILFDGVVIGKDCIIGAGTILLEGTIIEAGKIVAGSPGMIKGDVTEERKERKRWGTRLYQSLPARYRNTMKEIPLIDVLL